MFRNFKLLLLPLDFVVSSVERGGIEGVVFFLGYPRFHEDKFTTP